MTEIFKSMNYFNPPLVGEFHEKKHVAYGLRIHNLCKLLTVKTLSFGLEPLSFRGSFLWNTLDDSVKHEPILTCFKNDTTNFARGAELNPILKSLKKDVGLLSLWFANNYMKVNDDKGHLFVFGKRDEEATVNISGPLIKESDEEKLLGVTLDSKLNFKVT